MSQWDAAEREYRRAIELDPHNSNARHWYALFLDPIGRLDEAIAQYKHALGLDPLNLSLNINLAGIYEDKGQYDQALDQYKKTDNSSTSLLIVAAFLHSSSHNSYLPSSRYKRTFEIDPNYAPAHGNLSPAAIARHIMRAFYAACYVSKNM